MKPLKINKPKLLLMACSITLSSTTLSQEMTGTHAAEPAWRVSAAYHPRFVRTELAYESKPFWATTLFNKRFDLRLDAFVAYWRALHSVKMRHSHRSLWQVGLTPMVRWWPANHWYIEGGIGGLTLMNHTRFSNKEFSTAFQFGNSIGLGWFFADNWRFGMRYSHYSNASIKTPNPGFDILSFSISHTF